MKKNASSIFLAVAAAALGLTLASAVGLVFAAAASATGSPPFARFIESLRSREPDPVSPVRKISRQQHAQASAVPPAPDLRSIDGSGNNPADPSMGAANTRLSRIMAPAFADGIQQMAGSDRPDPRTISNLVSKQQRSMPNRKRASAFLWQWGQFLDHDLGLTDGTNPPEPADIPIPREDRVFDPDATGTAVMSFNRSIHDIDSGTGPDNPRQQVNEVTAWIDASNVYGSDAVRAAALRTNDGTGRLRTSAGNLLPFNTEGLPNAGGSSRELFLAGDVRANEQVALTAMHTVFVREHNRLAEAIAAENSVLTGDEIYQRARRLVGAQMQVITYEEFLPALLGAGALEPYQGYRPHVDASIMNVFSTASFRFGHSLLGRVLRRVDAHGAAIQAGHLPLKQAFFAPQRIIEEGGIEPLLRGLASQIAQNADPFVVDDVRSFLFGPPGNGGFDLVALNIQRGRDHGLPDYNSVRAALGLARKPDIAAVSGNAVIRKRLESAYQSVDQVDVWVGGLAEDAMPGAHVGELIFTVLKTQFEALRDGDRFWYERTLEGAELAAVRATRLSDVIRRNTTIGDEIPNDVFHVAAAPSLPAPGPPTPPPPPQNVPASGGSGSLGWFGLLTLLAGVARRLAAVGLLPSARSHFDLSGGYSVT